MSNNHTAPDEDLSVSLPLQSLIDARLNLSFAKQPVVQGLSPLSGQIKALRRGQGLEFEDLRSYTHGDDVRHIDWKVSARHNQLHTRLYREEKEQRITLMVDFTAGMFTGSTELLAVQAGYLAAHLAWHEVSAGGRCGLMIQTENEWVALPPALGDKAALAICAEIARTFKDAKSAAIAHDQTNHSGRSRLDQLRNSGREYGAFILLSHLEQANESTEQHLRSLNMEKQIAAVCIEDSMEYNAIPAGTYRFRSGGKSIKIILNEQQIQQLNQQMTERLKQLTNMFERANIPLLFSRHGISKTRADLHALGFIA